MLSGIKGLSSQSHSPSLQLPEALGNGMIPNVTGLLTCTLSLNRAGCSPGHFELLLHLASAYEEWAFMCTITRPFGNMANQSK